MGHFVEVPVGQANPQLKFASALVVAAFPAVEPGTEEKVRQKQAEIDAMDERGLLVASILWETTWGAKLSGWLLTLGIYTPENYHGTQKLMACNSMVFPLPLRGLYIRFAKGWIASLDPYGVQRVQWFWAIIFWNSSFSFLAFELLHQLLICGCAILHTFYIFVLPLLSGTYPFKAWSFLVFRKETVKRPSQSLAGLGWCFTLSGRSSIEPPAEKTISVTRICLEEVNNLKWLSTNKPLPDLLLCVYQGLIQTVQARTIPRSRRLDGYKNGYNNPEN